VYAGNCGRARGPRVERWGTTSERGPNQESPGTFGQHAKQTRGRFSASGALPHQSAEKTTTSLRPQFGHSALIITAGAGTLAIGSRRSRRGDKVCIMHLGEKTRGASGGRWRRTVGQKKKSRQAQTPWVRSCRLTCRRVSRAERAARRLVIRVESSQSTMLPANEPIASGMWPRQVAGYNSPIGTTGVINLPARNRQQRNPTTVPETAMYDGITIRLGRGPRNVTVLAPEGCN